MLVTLHTLCLTTYVHIYREMYIERVVITIRFYYYSSQNVFRWCIFGHYYPIHIYIYIYICKYIYIYIKREREREFERFIVLSVTRLKG